MKYTVRIHRAEQIIEKRSDAGINILSILQKNGIDLNSPCGGNGTCGKCRIRLEGLKGEVTQKELRMLGEGAVIKGYRLACFNVLDSDLDIYLDEVKQDAKIMTQGKMRKVKLNPIIKKKFVVLQSPDIEHQESDIQRISAAAEARNCEIPLELMRKLPEELRLNDFRVTIGIMDKSITFIEPGDTTSTLYGLALDIGTTTIAAYLLNLVTGKRIDVHSLLNPQKKYGADVLSRIDYSMKSCKSMNEMNELLIDCINEIIKTFCSRNGIEGKDIYTAALVGNTTIMHFLMNLPAENMAVSPFIPVTTEMHKINAIEAGLEINSFGSVIFLPTVSAYIGADTIAAVLSSGMYTTKRVSLLIDIGTNGEIVLGNSEWMYACSAAAGPAFEGANIRNGVGGIKGAIDSVDLSKGMKYTTIENERAIGICGSGIVDAVAALLSIGVIDETGRILTKEEFFDSQASDGVESLAEQICDIDEMNSFLLVKSEECDAGTDVAITQKDVRELQNAKAAIAAGIKILVNQSGIKMEDIHSVYLAGGFGSYINIESALKIGLIPIELSGKIVSIGNAAGEGAILSLLSDKILKKGDKLKDSIKYIELSSRPDFVEEYVECMMFE